MKIKYRQTVFVDVDGVICDFEGEFCDRFGYDNRHLASLTARYPEVPVDLIEEFVNSWDTYEKLMPIFGGGVLLLNVLKERGYYVVLLTSRPRHLAEVTREWLEGFDFQYNELWYAKNKAIAIEEFNNMYPRRRGFLLIDDIASNLVNLPDGVQGIAWSQPWNEGAYPRMQYNQDKMQLEVKVDTVSNWVKF